MEILNSPIKFDWDKHNIEHIRKHNLEPGECEQVFFNIPIVLKPDLIHSRTEQRHFALGRTNGYRILVVVFTIRKEQIRVITARDANKKERISYEKTQKNSTI